MDKPLPMDSRAGGPLGVFEQYGKAVGFFSGVLLLLSVFYDFNFLSALYLSFSDVPTTITDHVRTAIVWAPQTVLALFFTFLLAMFFRVIRLTDALAQSESGKPNASQETDTPDLKQVSGLKAILEKLKLSVSDEILQPNARKEKQGHSPRPRRIVAIVGVAVTYLVLGLLSFLIPWTYLYGAFIPLWILVSLRLLNYQLKSVIDEFRISDLAQALFVAVPIVFAYVGHSGYSDGLEMMRDSTYGPTNGRMIVIKTESSSLETCYALGVRRFSSFAIVVGADRGVTVLPADRLTESRKQVFVKYDEDAPCPKKKTLTRHE